MNTCIVAGNAWSLHDDLEKAGDHPVIAVNGAAKEIKAIALYSQHPERFFSLGWITAQKRFGDDFTVNSTGEGPEGVTYWPISKGGSSAWGARKLANLMGYSQVILCGCPLDVGPYVGNHNLTGLMHREDVILELRRQIMKDDKWHDGVISMSGWTREFFGDKQC